MHIDFRTQVTIGQPHEIHVKYSLHRCCKDGAKDYNRIKMPILMKDTSLFEINRWIVIIDAKELCCSIGDVNKNVISGPRDCNTIAPKPITDRYDLDEFSVKWFFFFANENNRKMAIRL